MVRLSYVLRGTLGFLVISAANSLAQEIPEGSSAASSPAISTETAPRMVRFSGSIKDASGKPVTVVAGVTFALYKEQEGGTALWLETQSVHLDTSGHYAVMLGATKPDGLPMELFTSGEARWLGVTPEGQAEQPRVLLLSVPYALKAVDSETLGGFPPSAFMLAPSFGLTADTAVSSTAGGSANTPSGSVTGSGTTNFVPLWTSSSNLGNSVLFQSGSGSTAKVGINTTTPASTFDVKGGGTIRGVLQLPSAGTATANAGFNSEPLNLQASSFNKGTGKAISQAFQWQAEPVGNDTLTPSGTLSLLFGSGSSKPTETGLKISSNGLFTFATDQTFPGTGTITGVSAGTDLTGGGTGGNITLNLNTAATDGRYAQLAATNTFLTGQAILGRLGVGTTSPAFPLHNYGSDNSFTGIQTRTTNTSASGNSFAAFSAEAALGSVVTQFFADGLGTGPLGTPGGYYGTYTNHPIGLFTNNTERMRITNTGNVLIGTTTHGNEMLTVVGNNSEPGFGGFFGGSSSSSGGFLGLLISGGNDTGSSTSGHGGTGQVSFGGDSLNGFGGIGIEATAGGGAQGNLPAGLFHGDLEVDGAIFAGTKDFKIDHPLDPANKYLTHASVESSEMMNIYTGNVMTNSQGDATVQLPQWFEALNTDFRYQLTAIGQFARAIISGEIASSHFTIKTDQPNVKVSWQVTGVRQDAYAKAHPLVVEQEKEERVRGFYIHPELYGAPEEKHIEWARQPELMKRMKEHRAMPTASTKHMELLRKQHQLGAALAPSVPAQ